jgi:uncharacterized protein YecE (DUF72 family)
MYFISSCSPLVYTRIICLKVIQVYRYIATANAILHWLFRLELFVMARRLVNFDEDQLKYFLDSLSELNEKLLALLIQLPPSIQIVEGLDALRNIIS